jgi:hypothetical protein
MELNRIEHANPDQEESSIGTSWYFCGPAKISR